MSLIHDSLRKLETKQVKNLGSGFAASEDSYVEKSFQLKKLWMGLVLVVGLVLVYYAYSILNNYQAQNEALLNDIKQMKTNTVAIDYNDSKPIVAETKKVIVQPPVIIKRDPDAKIFASLEVQKEVTELNNKLLNNNAKKQKKQENRYASVTSKKVPVLKASASKPMSQETKVVKVLKPKQKSLRKKNKSKKLSVKQTRVLVNSLQMQIELKNNQEVTSLLDKLAKSSGKESLVYLRMNAYWSNINDDKATAVMMYKKILFQKPYDIQAGTNLALIEAQSDQKAQALKRLELLKNKYPANKNVLDYFNKIEAN